WAWVNHKGLYSVCSFPDRTKSFGHAKFDHENETFRAIGHPQFGFLNRSMRFPVCCFSARLRRVRHGQPAWARTRVLEPVCSIKPGTPRAKRPATTKTQTRFRR